MEAYVKDDYSKVEMESISRLNDALDIPGLNEEEEAIILSSVVSAFFRIVEKRKRSEE